MKILSEAEAINTVLSKPDPPVNKHRCWFKRILDALYRILGSKVSLK